MRLIHFGPAHNISFSAVLPAGDRRLVDLGETVHPTHRAKAREQLASLAGAGRELVIVRLPADYVPADIAAVRDAGTMALVLSDVTEPESVRAAAVALAGAGIEARLVLELRSGKALGRAEVLATADTRVAGLWYGISDLLVDLDDAPPSLYFYDSPEPRLAAADWTRSYLLTVARANGLEFWGQLDLTFAELPDDQVLDQTIRRARHTGFDALVTRFPSTWTGRL